MSFVWCLFDFLRRCDGGKCCGQGLHMRRVGIWNKTLYHIACTLDKMLKKHIEETTAHATQMRAAYGKNDTNAAKQNARMTAEAMLNQVRTEVTQARIGRVREALNTANGLLQYWTRAYPPKRVEGDADLGSVSAENALMPAVIADSETFAAFDTVVCALYEAIEVAPEEIVAKIEAVVTDIDTVGLTTCPMYTAAEVRRGRHKVTSLHTIEEDDETLPQSTIPINQSDIEREICVISQRLLDGLKSQESEAIAKIVSQAK